MLDKTGHVSMLTKTCNMRKLLFAFLLLSVVVYLVGCSKCFWSETDPRCYVVDSGKWMPWPPAQPWNVVDHIDLACNNNGTVSWCGPNFYEFSFSLHGVYSAQYHNSHWFYDPDTPRQCYMRYVGPSPLFDTSKIVFRNLWHIDYRVDSSFLRRPMFEARFLDNDSLFQTFSFGDSGVVSVAYFDDIIDPDVPGDWSKGWHWRIPLFDSTKLTNDTLTKTFLR